MYPQIFSPSAATSKGWVDFFLPCPVLFSGPCVLYLLFFCLSFIVYSVIIWKYMLSKSPSDSQYIKFRHCEKAKKFAKNLPIFYNYLVTLKQSGGFFRIFMVFSEYLNSKRKIDVIFLKLFSSEWLSESYQTYHLLEK